jgi:hypothetical protein
MSAESNPHTPPGYSSPNNVAHDHFEAKEGFDPIVSFFPNSFENLPTDIKASQFSAGIKDGTYGGQIAEIRERFQTAIKRGVPYDKAKKAVDSPKKKLASVTLAGIQPMRGNEFTPQFTGLIQADLDLLGEKLKQVRKILTNDSHVFLLFISATGEGLKAWYRIPICKSADEYKFAFDALARHVLELTGCTLDPLKEVARLCYTSHDKDCFHNPQAVALPVDFSQMPPPAVETKKTAKCFAAPSSGESRRVIAEHQFGKIEWQSEMLGYCQCPGIDLHTNGNAPKDCRVMLDGSPTIYCLHKSCLAAVEKANHELRSQIGKMEYVPTRTPQAGQPATAPNSKRAEIAAGYLGEDNERLQPRVAKRLSELKRFTENDPDELLKYRYLCRGGGALWVAQTGIGKSTAEMQAAILWAVGKPFFGITPARPLKSLIIQAENDDGDLAEFKDGIYTGLKLTPEEIELADENIRIVTEDSRTGLHLCNHTIEPLLADFRPDILWLDPANSYLGGNVSAQEVVTPFLRNMLNPLIRKYGCAIIIVHHTNKPPKDKLEWTGADLAYLFAGAAEWGNWARAVLVINSTKSEDVFKLIASKRGSRIGWKDESGATTKTRMIAHSREPGLIYWREPDMDEVQESEQSNPRKTVEDIIALVPIETPILKNTLLDNAKGRGIGINKGRDLLNTAIEDKLLFIWPKKRHHTNPAIYIARKPQPKDEI